MKTALLLVAAIYGLVLIACLGIGAIGIAESSDHVYGVLDAQRLTDQPVSAWGRRPILVRGRLVLCQPIAMEGDRPCAILVPDTCPATGLDCPLPAGRFAIPLLPAGSNPLLARLRAVPLLGSLLPGPQEQLWGKVATYRVQMDLVPESLCGTRPCVEAQLVDAMW
jgi:hypothetical protein